MILVTGFGPFLDVEDNPSARLARAVHGASVGRHRVHGLVLPVSYDRAVATTLEAAREALLVLGTGVARQRSEPRLELRAVRERTAEHADVDGVCGGHNAPDGPEAVRATLGEAAARALGIGCSSDAGFYVCNGWLYGVVRGLPGVPVGFLHVPPDGFAPDRLLAGLAGLVG